MDICHSCNGVIGRDCWNPQVCAEITERMAMESSCQTAPSQTPEAAGLEVVAWASIGPASGEPCQVSFDNELTEQETS